MNTRLLKKVRKRYRISKLRVEPWMKRSTEFFDRDCWNRRTPEDECYITVDLRETDSHRLRVSSSYQEALDWLVFFIRKDYPSKKRFNQREKIIWGQ